MCASCVCARARAPGQDGRAASYTTRCGNPRRATLLATFTMLPGDPAFKCGMSHAWMTRVTIIVPTRLIPRVRSQSALLASRTNKHSPLYRLFSAAPGDAAPTTSPPQQPSRGITRSQRVPSQWSDTKKTPSNALHKPGEAPSGSSRSARSPAATSTRASPLLTRTSSPAPSSG